MIWLFERGDRATRVVTRLDSVTSEYILEVQWSDGAATLETFSDPESFKARLVALEQQLVAEEWKPADGSPRLTGDWWKP